MEICLDEIIQEGMFVLFIYFIFIFINKDILDILQQNFDVIKMDIEGGELRIFKKIINHQLIPKANNWFVKFHQIEKNQKQFEETLNCFKENGFKKEERKEVIYFYKNI